MTCRQQGSRECKETGTHCLRPDRGQGHPLWRSSWQMERLHHEQSQGRILATTSTVRCFTTEIGVTRGGTGLPEPPWIIPTAVFPDQEGVGEEGAPTILYPDHLQTFRIPLKIHWEEGGGGHLMDQEIFILRNPLFTGHPVRGG